MFDMLRTERSMRSKMYHGKTVLITGAGSGMGQEMAVMFVRSCVQKVIMCDLTVERLAETVKRCRAECSNVVLETKGIDVADEAAMAAWGEEKKDEPIEYLICNVGVVGGRGLLNTPKTEWDRIFNVNFYGTVNTTRAFLPNVLLCPATTACGVVVMSSVNGFYSCVHTNVPHNAYVAAKFALRGFTESLMVELAGNQNVTVTAVHPGVVGTELIANCHGGMEMTEREKTVVRILKKIPLIRSFCHGIDEDASDDALRARLGAVFKQIAPIDGREAADVIISSVARRHTRVLVGGDAYFFDYSVRIFPRFTYHPAYFPVIALFYTLRQIYLFFYRRPLVTLPCLTFAAYRQRSFLQRTLQWIFSTVLLYTAPQMLII